MDWITKLLDVKKIPTNWIFIIWVILLLLLFLPEEFIGKLELTEFKKDYGKFFGIIFLASSGLLIVFCASWIYKKINSRSLKKKYKALIIESVLNLDSHEKAVLREFYIQGKNTIKIPMDNPTVSGLINKRIIYQVGRYGEMSSVGMLFNYAISETARKQLTLEIVELPSGEPTQQEIERIRNSRPRWMIKLESNRRIFESL